MDLQFALDESFETLCFHYLLNQSSKSKLVILNSILLSCGTSQFPLSILFDTSLQIFNDHHGENQQSVSAKDCYKNMAELFTNFIHKVPRAICSTPIAKKIAIVSYCCQRVYCAVSGNNFINLIFQIACKTSPLQAEHIAETVEKMLFDNKMHISSYRQVTRNQLYYFQLMVLKNKKAQLMTTAVLEKVVRSVEDEKDPRNMTSVLQIYNLILKCSPLPAILPLLDKIFECLEMYYPIDFEGDPSKHNIDLNRISNLLDQCLTHPLFSSKLESLLKVKMAAVPISKYIPTFLMSRPETYSSSDFFLKMLEKTAEEEFLQEEHDSEYNLSDFIVQLLKRIVRQPISLSAYFVLTKWMKTMIVDYVFSCEDNAKMAGRVIQVVQKVIQKGCEEGKKILSTFIGKNFIEHKKSPGEILYKLGMMVPVLQNCQLDAEQAALLVLTVTQIFHQEEEPQPKLLVLKVLMLLAADNSKLVNQTNILHECLLAVKNANQPPTISKAFTDFLVQLYSHDVRVEESIKTNPSLNVKTYGIITLTLKTGQQKHIQCLQEMWQENEKECMSVVKTFRWEGIIKTCQSLRSISLETAKELEKQFIKRKANQQENELEKAMYTYINENSGLLTVFLLKSLWRQALCQSQIRNNVKSVILKNLLQETQENAPIAFTCAAFFNKAMESFKIDEFIDCNQKNEAYVAEVGRLLPIDFKRLYLGDYNCQPTLIHYVWAHQGQNKIDLIKFLPDCILSKEAESILPLIIAAGDLSTLSKIFMSVPEHVAASEVLPFIENFVSSVSSSTEVKQAVAANSIIADCLKRAEEESDVHEQLLRLKGKILIALEEKGLQHHKRKVRQSARRVFSELNMLK